jgi:hypothetical protein
VGGEERGGGGGESAMEEEELEKDLKKMMGPGLTKEQLVERAMLDNSLVEKHGAKQGDTGKRAWLLKHLRKVGDKLLGDPGAVPQARHPEPAAAPRTAGGAAAGRRGGGAGEGGDAVHADPDGPSSPAAGPRGGNGGDRSGAAGGEGGQEGAGARDSPPELSAEQRKQLLDKALGEVAKADAARAVVDASAAGDFRTLPDGSRYRGPIQIVQDAAGNRPLPHGKGHKERSSGEVFWGDFEQGRYHGYGVLQLPDSSVYTGQFVNGKYEGVGRMCLASGDEYLGQFRQGTYHGLGQYKSKDKCTAAIFNKGQLHHKLPP